MRGVGGGRRGAAGRSGVLGRIRRGIAVPAAVAAVIAVSGCAAPVVGAVRASSTIRLPPTTGGFDYQLGGGSPPAPGVTVITRDSTDRPAPGVYSICYVNGFQTQPGARWPASLLLHTASGALLVDPGWPDEHLLDVSTAAKRAAAAARQARTVAGCARRGFAAVEFDNLDSWTRSRGGLTRADAVAFARLLVRTAHAHGLAASQKNTAELGRAGRRTIGFDFVTAEECDRYAECGAYTRVYGRHVLDVEYAGEVRGTVATVCARSSLPPQTVFRDRDLLPRGARGHVERRC